MNKKVQLFLCYVSFDRSDSDNVTETVLNLESISLELDYLFHQSVYAADSDLGPFLIHL